MVVSVVSKNDSNDGLSYARLILDVMFIFLMGLFLLIVFKTFTSNNKMYFAIALSIYLILISMYTILYMSMVKNDALKNSIHHRLISFISVYNVFLAIFMIIVALSQI